MEAAHRYIGAKENSQFLAMEESESASWLVLEASSANATGHRNAKTTNTIIKLDFNLIIRIPL
jgi:hypothetical protein